jgi:hypothetical protein
MVQESGDRDEHEIEPKGGRPGPTAPDLPEPTSDTD